MFIRNIQNITMPRDVIAVDSTTKDYLQQKGFAPIGYKDYKWIFHKTDTLTNILNARQKEVAKKDADS